MKTKNFYFILLVTSFIHSQSISPDIPFGTNGVFNMPFSSTGNDQGKIKLLDNGKILFFSTRYNQNQYFLTRINTNGTIDASFATNGYLVPNMVGQYQKNFKILPNNKILLYGGENPVKLIQLNEDGSYDSSFGSNGTIELPLNSTSSDQSIQFSNNNLLVQNDGKIIVQYLVNNTIYLKRFNQNGITDNTFGTNGITQNIQSKRIFLTSENKIIGFRHTGNSYTLEKFNSDGTLDNFFGINGILTNNLVYDNFDTIYVEQDSEGRLIVVKLTTNSGQYFEALRINLNGIVDTSFGLNGYVNFPNFPLIIEESIYKNNKYYFVGSTGVAGNYQDLIILTYNENGTLDTSFNNSGYKIDNASTNREFGESILVQDDGKIVVSGQYIFDPLTTLFLSRYVDVPLNISEFKNDNLFKILNPISEQLSIISENELESITLVNLNGKLIFESDQKVINTSNLSKGIYIVVVKFKNNNQRYFEKIIKK